MEFAAVIEDAAGSRAAEKNFITDGGSVCAYPDLPGQLDRIAGFLKAREIDNREAIAVECLNSVPGVLLLCALLRGGYSFLLIPPAAGAWKPVPRFCRFRLTVLPAPLGDSWTPEAVFQIQANPDYAARSVPGARLMLRTSGSMGASKIAVHAHSGLMGNAGNCVQKYGFSAESRVAIPVPVAHMYGFGAALLPALLAGASIDLQHNTNLLKYLDREKHFRPTIALATPAVCGMLAKGYKAPRNCYRVFVTSGQNIEERLFRTFDALIGGRLINQYGSTEMGAISACGLDDSLEVRASSIGGPMPGVSLRVDGEANSGQLYCRHPYGFEGYLDEDGAWLMRPEPGSWYGTGDIAALRDDGRLAVLGRAGDAVNRRGYLVTLAEIERTMAALDPVSEVAVVGDARENSQGQRVSAFCVLRSGFALDGEQLRQQCRQALPNYAIPDEVHIVAALPLLSSGKTDRQRLAAAAG